MKNVVMKTDVKPASPELEKLNVFVGRWKTTGKVYATADSPEIAIHATDVYEWLEGGFFLIHRWDALMGEKRHTGMEVISYDAVSKTYPMHSYTDEGNQGDMVATIDDNGVWTFGDDNERSTTTFSADGNIMKGFWEMRQSDGSRKPWMEVKLVK